MHSLVQNIKSAFSYLDGEIITKFIVPFCPRLEYSEVALLQYVKKGISRIERIQSAVTKITKGLRDLQYEERLSRLKLKL